MNYMHQEVYTPANTTCMFLEQSKQQAAREEDFFIAISHHIKSILQNNAGLVSLFEGDVHQNSDERHGTKLVFWSVLSSPFSLLSFCRTMATAKSASYDYLIKLLLIGDSGMGRWGLLLSLMMCSHPVISFYHFSGRVKVWAKAVCFYAFPTTLLHRLSSPLSASISRFVR